MEDHQIGSPEAATVGAPLCRASRGTWRGTVHRVMVVLAVVVAGWFLAVMVGVVLIDIFCNVKAVVFDSLDSSCCNPTLGCNRAYRGYEQANR